MSDQAKELKQLLINIFEDEIVEPKEREALSQFTSSMSAEEATAVFKEFLHDKWGEAIADGIITGAEMRLLGHVVTELNLELEQLPMQARMALKDAI